MTEESLPTEYSITGRSNSATTSRMTWMLSASSCIRCEMEYCGMAGPADSYRQDSTWFMTIAADSATVSREVSIRSSGSSGAS